jgi:hypothetical protein
MNRFLLFLVLSCTSQVIHAQYVYTIKADSVKITNSCDTAELIIENHTQDVCGFLFNKGKGRTEFRRAAMRLNDSMYLIGCDTIMMSPNALNGLSKNNGSIVWGQNPGQPGNPATLLNDREIPMNGHSVNFNNGRVVVSKSVSGTENSSVVDLSTTWNTTASPSALKLNVINTSSGADANLLDIQQDGLTRLKLLKNPAEIIVGTFGPRINQVGGVQGGLSLTAYQATSNQFIVGMGFKLSSSDGISGLANRNVINFEAQDNLSTSGSSSILNLSKGRFYVTSGTAEMNMFNIGTTVEQSGSASGITRGIYINPTIISAADFRALEIATGKSILNGKVTVNSSLSPTAGLLLGAGSTTAGSAPLKLTAGAVLTTPENGAIEFDGTDLYLTENTSRYKLAKTVGGQVTTDFGVSSLSAFNNVTTTLTVTGAQPGDVVNVSANSGAVNPASIIITGYVTSAHTVTLRAYNASNSAVPIASDTYEVRVIR